MYSAVPLDVVKSFMLEARLGKPLDFDEIDKTGTVAGAGFLMLMISLGKCV